MREILFRGKRNDNGEWVYGFPFISSASQVGISKWDGNAEMNSVEDDEWSRWDIYNLFVPKIDPKTVGQYTGLKDKSGEKVFEGDVIKFGKPHGDWGCLAEIIFENGAYMYRSITNAKKVWNCIFAAEETPFSIIGNIHDNPELLNQSGS